MPSVSSSAHRSVSVAQALPTVPIRNSQMRRAHSARGAHGRMIGAPFTIAPLQRLMSMRIDASDASADSPEGIVNISLQSVQQTVQVAHVSADFLMVYNPSRIVHEAQASEQQTRQLAHIAVSNSHQQALSAVQAATSNAAQVSTVAADRIREVGN